MRCPVCGTANNHVIDSRPAESGRAIRRRRECDACQHRFTTYERLEVVLMVRKRDGATEAFSVAKLRNGIDFALADRPFNSDERAGVVDELESEISTHDSPISSDEIGRLVLGRLRDIDEVAYLRFASVYKEFSGTRDFELEMAAMEDSAVSD